MRNSSTCLIVILMMMSTAAARAESTASDLERIEAETLLLKARQKKIEVEAQIAAKENEIASKRATQVMYARTASSMDPVVRSIEGIGKSIYATLQFENGGLVDVKAGDRLQNGMRVVSVQANEVIVETAKRQRIRLLTSAGGAHSYGSGYAGATPPLPPLSPAQGIRGVMP